MEDQVLFDRLFDNTSCLDNGCIMWLGGCTPNGYGKIKYKGQTLSTHRLSFKLCKDEVPEGLLVLHSCDFKPCINPNHLFLGTAKDNKHDCMNKDRHAYGELQGLSKLRRKDVQEIRRLLNEGELTQKAIGQYFNIAQSTVSGIKYKRDWAWLSEVNPQ